MYNIALCFYGEGRNWYCGAETVKKFKTKLSPKKFNTDVYFHLWDNITRKFDISTKDKENTFIDIIKKNKNLDDIFVVESNLQHKELLNTVKPVNYKIENKNVLDAYIDKFNPSNKFMSCEDIKLAVKYSNTPCFSQFYSMSQSFKVIENKQKYDLIIIIKADCEIKDNSVTNTILKKYCKYVIKFKNQFLIHDIVLRPRRKEVWLWHGYMMGSYLIYNKLWGDFPKIPMGMGLWPRYKWKSHAHAEFADYVLNHTSINRVIPIDSDFKGRFNQFVIQSLT